MGNVVLVYPYFIGSKRSEFRFPPLGLGYLASQLREHGITVEIVDCTFLGGLDEAVQHVKDMSPSIIGIYSMFTMKDNALILGERLKDHCELLVAGGPQPSSDPEAFLDLFDVVIIGEGEETVLEIVEGKKSLREVRGVAFMEKYNESSRLPENMVITEPRGLIPDLDSIPFPARDIFDNQSYIAYYREMGLRPTTSIMSSRGCVFKCDFCSQPIYGNTFRERSPSNIVDEIAEILELGYEKVVFQDDCFTLTKERVVDFCLEVIQKGTSFEWECLSRVDSLDEDTALLMKRAGCSRVFFGLESGSDKILRIMNKQTDKKRAVEAINSAKKVGIKAGAFFIIGYPGETNATLIETINFAGSLGLDYLSFNFPYPIPGTGLFEKLKDDLIGAESQTDRNQLLFKSHISERKLRFAEYKGMTQHRISKALGPFSGILQWPFQMATDAILRMMD